MRFPSAHLWCVVALDFIYADEILGTRCCHMVSILSGPYEAIYTLYGNANQSTLSHLETIESAHRPLYYELHP